MKKPETTLTFVIICVVILVAAYGIGFCIHEIKASRIEAAQNKILSKQIEDLKTSSDDYQTQETVYTQNRRNWQQPNRTNNQNNTNANDILQRLTSPRGGNTSTTRRGMQNFEGQDYTTMMENFRNQGMNNRGFGAYGNSSAMGMPYFNEQNMFNDFYNNQGMPGNQETVEEPNNYNLQGGY